MAMNMKTLKDKVKEFSVSLPIMENREKGDFADIKGEIVTISDFDFMKDDGKEYVVFTIKEDTKNFYFGGQVLTDNMKSLENDGYAETVREEGLPVKFTTKKSKNKRDYTVVEFYPEA
jgi:hypothetical protein